MTARVHTARFQWQGSGRIDTTRAANHPLSPSFALIQDALEMRPPNTPAQCLPTDGLRRRYKGELRNAARGRWDDVASLVRDVWEHGNAVLVCYCSAANCHRTVLADFLVVIAPRVGVTLARGRELRVTTGHITLARRDARGRRCVRFNDSEPADSEAPRRSLSLFDDRARQEQE